MSNADTPADQAGGNTAAPTTSPLGELPPRIRVHALAKLLGSNSREILAKLTELGESPRSAQSSVTREVAIRLAEALSADSTGEEAGQPAAAEPAATPAADAPAAEASAADTPAAETRAADAPVTEASPAAAHAHASEAPSSDAAAADAPAVEAPAKSGGRRTVRRGASRAAGQPFSDQPAGNQETAGQQAGTQSTGKTGTQPATGQQAAEPESGRRSAAGQQAAEAQAEPSATEPAEQAERPTGRRKRPVHVPVFAAPSPVFLPPEAEPAPAKRSKPGPVFGVVEEPADEDQAEETADEQDDRDNRDDDDSDEAAGRRRRRRGRRGRGRGKGGDEGSGEGEDEAADEQPERPQGRKRGRGGDTNEDDKPAEAESAESEDSSGDADSDNDSDGGNKRRRRRRRRKGGDDDSSDGSGTDDPPNTVTHVRQAKAEQQPAERPARDEVRSVRGSTRLEAKRQRRRDGREAGRRRAPILSEAEFLARREAVERTMVVAEKGDSTQIGVLEDGVLVEHFVTSSGTGSIVGNVYLGRVQNVLPSMEAAFIDIGRGRNAVLYAGEVDWDAAGLEGKARKIEQALSTGDSVLVQVTKDPVGHKGARLTTQISLPGRFLVYVPAGGATGISRKLPENERRRLKDILKRIVPEDAGVIIRTASEGIVEEELDRDVRRLKAQWDVIKEKAGSGQPKKGGAPTMLYEEPDLLVKVVRDLFTEDFAKLEVQGSRAWDTIHSYVEHVAPDLIGRLKRYTGTGDAFADHRIDEQITKALDRKVWLPSGGYLVIDRTEAMTVIDVNTGKFTGSGGNLEETVTRNNLESAEEIVRQLRLRDIGGIIVIDFIDMVLESNRELVLRRLTECLGRDRTRHQVAEVTSLGLVQMTRKKIGTGLLEAFSTPCEHCKGRGVVVSTEPQRTAGGGNGNGGNNGHNHGGGGESKSSRRSRGGRGKGEDSPQQAEPKTEPVQPAPTPEQRESVVTAVQAMANAAKVVAAKPESEEHSPEATDTAQTGTAPTGTGQTDTVQTETGQTETARTETGQTGTAQTGTAPTGTGQTDTARTGTARTGTARTGTARTGTAPTGTGRTGTAEASEVHEAAPAVPEPAVEVAGQPVTSPADEVEVPQEEPVVAATPEPEPAEQPVTHRETSGGADQSAAPESEIEVPAPAARSTRRRPRRTASRPAGPPVHASEQS
ncbi:translation initiation factor IF-2 N-terminal domain-containing protein [Amycolatopsis saalfeldensis]|uniref:Ribonuclease E n=1 Tax=Amycolatopsis saalfeldensis TaxID=394193 RepID=A0A1H8Y2U7_9PSEU|nr:translation initiation factor IF-2 N-terminal domain-containing protein [Amycolatopsis saalfeldensis]SEP45848.1 ribonuclease E [Amycolatopsis saalfeldensis]